MEKIEEKRKSFALKKALIFFTIPLILLGITVASLWYFKSSNSNNSTQLVVDNNQCTNDSIRSTKLKNIKIIIENNKPEELKKIVDEITSISGYQNDQNCLYPIVKYYLLIGDSGKAREYFNLYNKVYTSSEKYFILYGPGLEDPIFLKNQVEFSEKLKKEAEKNAFYGPEVSE